MQTTGVETVKGSDDRALLATEMKHVPETDDADDAEEDAERYMV